MLSAVLALCLGGYVHPPWWPLAFGVGLLGVFPDATGVESGARGMCKQ